ncbi:hypothetical protein [Campylobacter sp. CCS1377]|uniref:Secreted protein n=1 Tax=Campylobacter sp. CCS1377 TaxID=3158229 RepID=A0AAU7E6W9_9BACT|nr:hypothetical protein [Campylobacter jejuni]
MKKTLLLLLVLTNFSFGFNGDCSFEQSEYEMALRQFEWEQDEYTYNRAMRAQENLEQCYTNLRMELENVANQLRIMGY